MQQNLYVQIEPKRSPNDLAEAWESAPAESFFWYAVNLAKRWYPPNKNNFNDFLFTWKNKQQKRQTDKQSQQQQIKRRNKKKEKKNLVTRFLVTPLRRYPLRRYAFY